jgi:DNA-directed RNA polymerase specialized sigma24 family protein
VLEQTAVDAFTEFVRDVEPRLKRALVAAFGRDAGLEATADALAFAWEQWDRVRRVDNPAGYLWGVGRNKARRAKKRRPLFPDVPAHHEPWIEPGLPGAIADLTPSQRAAVVLIHGYGWTHAAVAEVLSVTIPTVQKHAERGMQKLRRTMGVSS